MVRQLEKTVGEQSELLDSRKREIEQVKADLDSTLREWNELSDVKRLLEETQKKLQIVEQRNESYQKNLDELTNESNGLREAKLNNGKEITEYRINYQHLENDLQHKCKTIEDKQKIIESQAAQIKQIEGELKQWKANFKKSESKLKECCSQINKGNQVIKVIRDEKKVLKNKYKEVSENLKKTSEEYSEYKELSETELKDLKPKAKLCEEQKSTIEYLQKKLTDEQKLNQNFMPQSQPEKLTTAPKPFMSSIPKTTGFQPTTYKSSFLSTERPASSVTPTGPGADRYSFSKPHYGSSHQSPYSRYSESKTLQGPPSASSLHSMNISGVSKQSSSQSSYHIHCPQSDAKSFRKELDMPEATFNAIGENKSPNVMQMSLVHTTKPAQVAATSKDFGTASDADDSDDSEDSERSQEGIIPIKYIQESQ